MKNANSAVNASRSVGEPTKPVRGEKGPSTLRVAHVAPLFVPAIGGVVTHVDGLSRGLAERGFRVEVLTTDPTGELHRIESIGGVSVRRFRSWAPADRYYLSVSLARFLKRESADYDIVHLHNYLALPALFGVLFKSKNKVVFSPYFHTFSQSMISRLLRFPYRALWSRLVRRVDKFIFVSDAEMSFFCSQFKVDVGRCVVIPAGVNVEHIANAEPLEESGKVVLYVGRLEAYKNVDALIKAMVHLEAEFVLRIVGDGPNKDNLVNLIEQLGLGGRVKIMSGLTNWQVGRWYASCSVFASLSSSESFGITLVEAFAAGKPVVASDIPSYKEIASGLKGTYFVHLRELDPGAVAEAIALAAVGEGSDNDVRKFTWERVSQRVGQVYHDLAGR